MSQIAAGVDVTECCLIVETHLPLTLLSEDLSLSYVHSVPGYSQLQLLLPALDSQGLDGPRS